MPEFQKPPPLKIKCTSADCENELHCFKQLKKMTEEQRGKCRFCGADLVNWDRLHMRDFGDVVVHVRGAEERDDPALLPPSGARREGRAARAAQGSYSAQGCRAAPAGEVSRACDARPGRSSDPVRRERHLLRSACDGHVLPDVPRVLARHSERPGIDRRRAGVLCGAGGLLSGRAAAGVGGHAHHGAQHATGCGSQCGKREGIGDGAPRFTR